MNQIKKIKNPDTVETIDNLFTIMKELDYKPKQRGKLTKQDLKVIIVKYETFLKKEYK